MVTSTRQSTNRFESMDGRAPSFDKCNKCPIRKQRVSGYGESMGTNQPAPTLHQHGHHGIVIFIGQPGAVTDGLEPIGDQR